MEILYTKQEVAKYLKVSTRTIERLIIKLDIPIYNIGRQVRIPESSQQLLMRSNSFTTVERQNIINNLFGRN